MIKVDGNKVEIGMEKNIYNMMRNIEDAAGIPAEESAKIALKAFLYGDLCALIQAIYNQLGDKEETLQLWTNVAETFVKENNDNE